MSFEIEELCFHAQELSLINRHVGEKLKLDNTPSNCSLRTVN